MIAKRLFIPIVLVLSLVGCQNGCTTAHTLDRESIDLVKNGQKVTVTARVVDYRNSKKIGRNIFHRSVTHTYGLSIDIAYRGQVHRDTYEEDVADPDAVDLDKELKRVKLALSNDGNHLGIGMDNDVVNVLHFYKEHEILSPAVSALYPDGLKWSELKINSYPSPRELILGDVSRQCDFSMMNRDLVEIYMDDQAASDTVHRMMLSKWPDCRLAEGYYTPVRVRKLKKDKTWKKWAVERSKEEIRLASSWTSEEEKNAFYNALNDREVNLLYDSLLVSGWGRKGSDNALAIITARLKGNGRSFSSQDRAMLKQAAAENVKRFMQKGESDYQREAYTCLRVLSASGDTTLSWEFLKTAFGDRQNHYDQFDLVECIYDNYEWYTPAQQAYIVSNTPRFFRETRDYVRSSVFRAVDDIMDCKQLRQWKKDYPEDLDFCELPKGC